MRVDFPIAGEILGFDVPDDRLVGVWLGPEGRPIGEARGLVADALESPLDFPPLRRAVVPGDRVALAWDVQTPEPIAVLSEVVRVLGEAGVDRDAIRVVTPEGGASAFGGERPEGVTLSIHDPGDPAATAYLASTTQGRRIYLNRHLIDADAVVAVGRLGFDPGAGVRGPWSALYPALSNAEAIASGRPSAEEQAEVGWLLGSSFQVGLLDGVSGVREVLAGLDSAVRARGTDRIEATWRFRADRRAALVVAGVGPSAGIDELALALESACKLVQRGGKIVLLSRVAGPIGRACRRILDLDDPRTAPNRLRGYESEPDFAAARRIAESLAWADVYLYSRLGDEADGLVTAALGRPEEARRLVAASESSTFLGSAERTMAEVLDDDD